MQQAGSDVVVTGITPVFTCLADNYSGEKTRLAATTGNRNKTN